MKPIQMKFQELAEAAQDLATAFAEGMLPGGSISSNLGSRLENSQDAADKVTWQTTALSLLQSVFGIEHTVSRKFETILTERNRSATAVRSQFNHLVAVFNSAKMQLDGGYLFDVRKLVHADVFTDELEQAEHFLGEGYKSPAAVIAGTVLESALRELCDQHPDFETHEKAGNMNDLLGKHGVYNKARKSQVLSWLQIRNSAAHGKPDEFNETQAQGMIDGIRDFIASIMA